MPKPKHRGRPRRTGLYITLAVLLVLVCGALTWRFVAPDSWSKVFAGGEKDKPDPHIGQVAVLISPVPIGAYTMLDPTAFINPTTGSFYVKWVDEKFAKDLALIRDPSLLHGRVLKFDKSPWLAFSELDFAPKGTRPGMTGAIEPGFRGVSLSAKEIEGLRGLKRFDRFDLYAVKVKRTTPGGTTSAYLSPEARSAADAGSEWSTDRLVIAQNAKILVPVSTAPNAKNADDVYASIRDEEATALADARAKGATIVCLMRSGLPGGDTAEFTRPEDPAPNDGILVITGDKSSTTYVPATKPDASTPIPDAEPK